MANDAAPDLLSTAFARMFAASRNEPPIDVERRLELLGKLHTWIVKNEARVAAAISADFGHRAVQETRAAEIGLVVGDLQHTEANLRAWARPEARTTHWGFLPASSRVVRQALGVVGIMAPWNYPFQLVAVPLTTAIAAGNRVLIKPSELTPQVAELVREMVHAVFPTDMVEVITGDVSVAAAFSKLPFDHLFFTGSTSVGKVVMRAAAENLTPVTLELGGKSPAIVHASADVGRTAASIASGKLLNAGQTCIAPDYILAPPDKVAPLVAALKAAMSKAYPRILDNPDYTGIANDRHFARLAALVDDAVKKGATAEVVNPAGESPGAARKMFPTILTNVTDDMLVMQDEIFGPILPVVAVKDNDAAIAYVNAHPRPLALYYFDDDAGRAEHVLARTTSGGAAINETLFHMAQHDLPFGGVGPSGMGRYHGYDGFRTFSHEKAVFYQSRFNGASTIRPPYGKLFDMAMKLFIR